MTGSNLSARERAKACLHKRFGRRTDPNGYVDRPQDNLIPGVRLDQFEPDLRRGDGNKLRMKFCAVHSSAALTVNCFAPFKDSPGEIRLMGHHGVKSVEFEKPLRIFRGGTPANIDVWIELDDGAIAIESKFLEYFEPKKPDFSPAYDRLAPPVSERNWWMAFTEAKKGVPQHLDRAQLLKHYFGLRHLQQSQTTPKTLTLLYLFWEPLNWKEIAECRQHRKGVEEFAEGLAGSSIPFGWLTYSQLWSEWAEVPALKEHAGRLKTRYEVSI